VYLPCLPVFGGSSPVLCLYALSARALSLVCVEVRECERLCRWSAPVRLLPCNIINSTALSLVLAVVQQEGQ